MVDVRTPNLIRRPTRLIRPLRGTFSHGEKVGASAGARMTAPTSHPRSPAARLPLPRFALSQELVLLFALIALFVVVGVINPRFVDWARRAAVVDLRNLKSIFLGNAYIAVAAIGMSMVIISGNIDISVGSLIGVLATISGTLAVDGVPIVLVLDHPGHRLDRLHDADGRDGRLSAHPVDRGQPRLPVDPEGRADQRHRRRLDQRAAGRLPPRADAAARRADADLFHGGA